MAPKDKKDEAEEIVAMDDHSSKEKKGDNPLVRLDLDHITYAPLTKAAEGESSRTTILSNITTTIAPYQLTAWMGPSGSGMSLETRKYEKQPFLHSLFFSSFFLPQEKPV